MMSAQAGVDGLLSWAPEVAVLQRKSGKDTATSRETSRTLLVWVAVLVVARILLALLFG